MNRIIFCLIFSFEVALSSSQTTDIQAQQNLTQLGLVSGNSVDPIGIKNKDKETDVFGSPYLASEFLPGTVVIYKNKEVLKRKLRYNSLDDKLELAMNSYYMKLNTKPIESFSIDVGNDVREFFNSRYISELSDEGFYQKVFEGNKVTIFVKHATKRKFYDSTKPYGPSKDRVEYQSSKRIYFIYENQTIEIKKKKDLQKIDMLDSWKKPIKNKNLDDVDFLIKLGQFIEDK